MRNLSILIPLVLLAACKDAAPASPPYHFLSHKLAKDEYRLTLKGAPGMPVKELERFMETRARTMCGGPFLKRGRKVESYYENIAKPDAGTTAKYYVLKSEIECVE